MVTKNIMGKQYHQGRFIQMGESKTETKTKVISRIDEMWQWSEAIHSNSVQHLGAVRRYYWLLIRGDGIISAMGGVCFVKN